VLQRPIAPLRLFSMLELSKHQLIIPDYVLHMISYDHVLHMIINDQHLGTIMFIDDGPVEVLKKKDCAHAAQTFSHLAHGA
jgi:hypothetical protein